MSLLDRLLDASIVRSFDRTGFERHARSFAEEGRRSLAGRDVLITGGTAGIGRAVADGLAEARLHLWSRDAVKGAAAAAALPDARFTSVDLGDLAAVGAAARALDAPRLAAVVLNAGAMPERRTETAQGHELIWASQVLGHRLLLEVLRRRGLLAADCRVIWVSSGGMYATKLDLSDLERRRSYQKHTVYAVAKRAQVILGAELAAAWPEVTSAVMHPGWVDTEAVRTSMPVFYRLLGPWLRDAPQGADTVVWLATRAEAPASGELWFDRASVPVHLGAWTRESAEDRAALVRSVDEAIAPWVSGG
jgi:dehydrogenase/reductase SDR family protein 12